MVARGDLMWPCSSKVSFCRRHMRLLVPLPTGGMGQKWTA